MIDDRVPEGFERHFRQSPLTDPWEPLYSRREGDRFHLGLRVQNAHCNSRGKAHGGLISALADNAMGLACVLAAGDQAGSAVTVQMSVDFIGAIETGQWLEIIAKPTKLGRTLAFAEARVAADGELTARATAVFRMLIG